MAAGTNNFDIEQGADFLATIRWTGPTGTPIDITDYEIRMMARVNMEDELPVISLSTENPPGGIAITNAQGGTFQIAMSAAETALLNFVDAYYDLEMESPQGHVTRLIQGKINLIREVTNPLPPEEPAP